MIPYTVWTFVLLTIYILYKLLWPRKKIYFQLDRSHAVLITGAASGIGLELAKHYYKQGLTVLATYRSPNRPGLRELQELKNGAKSEEDANRLQLVKLDISDKESIRNSLPVVEVILEKVGAKLYALINNAAVYTMGRFDHTTLDQLDSMLLTNYRGTVLATKVYLDLLKAGKGRIINVSSVLSYLPGIESTIYCNSKWSMNQFSFLLNEELSRPFGVRCINVVVGNYPSQTDIFREALQSFEQQWCELSPAKQLYYRDLFERLRQRLQCSRDVFLGSQGEHQDQFKSLWSRLRYSLISLMYHSCARPGQKLIDTNLIEYFHDAVFHRDCPQQLFAIEGPLRHLGFLLPHLPRIYFNLEAQPWSHTDNKNKAV